MRSPEKKARQKAGAKTESENHSEKENQFSDGADVAQIKQATIFVLFGVSTLLGMIGAYIWNIGDSFKPASVVFIILALIFGLVAIILQVLAAIRVERPVSILHKSIQTTGEPFSVKIITTFATPHKGMNAAFWYKSFSSHIVSPIHRMMLVRITNCQKNRSQIETYRVEALTVDNEWKQLTWMDGSRGDVYSITGDPASAFLVALEKLDSIISSRIVTPNETIEGWTFFEIPDTPLTHQFRVYVKDFGGAVTNQIVEENHNEFTQGTQMRFLHKYDLSKATFGYYGG